MGTILITGANRGLGLEFVKQYLHNGDDVIATCRSPDAANHLSALAQKHSGLSIVALEMTDFAAIDALSKILHRQPIDILINNAAIFGPKPHADGDHRQDFGHIDYDLWSSMLRINTMAPVKMSEAFLPQLRLGTQRKIVTISSSLGSIASTESRLYLYPTSKSAVNMAMATLAKDLRSEHIIVVVINPGWVKTDMGGPQALLEISESVGSVLQQIKKLTLAKSGAFLNYDGDSVPW